MYKDIPLTIEVMGGEYCTALSLVKIGYSQTGHLYDEPTLWDATPHTELGANPIDTIHTAINMGLKNIATGLIEKLWDNYMTPVDIQKDMETCQSACMINGFWYKEWMGLTPNSIMPQGVNIVSDHSFIVKDWINGNAVIDSHQGFDLLMPSSMLYNEIQGVGCSAYIPTNPVINARRKINFLQYILELYQQLITLKRFMINSQSATITPMQTPVNAVVTEPQVMVSKSQRLYDLAVSLLGKTLTLDTSVPANFGCAEAISYVLKEFGYPMPVRGYASTDTLNTWLSQNCIEVDTPLVGDIIISITQGNNHGHTGIIGKETIMSNDSQTGLWEDYWSMTGWQEFYTIGKKLVTKFYRLK